MSEIYIGDVLIDQGGEFISVPLNKAIVEIQDPSQRGGEFTKTVVIPGTNTNNILFGQIFDVSLSIQNNSATENFLPDFNPNLRASCRVYVKGCLQIEGYCQLLQINILAENKIEYEITIVGNVGSVFSVIGSKTLGDLDFSEYDHVLSLINVQNSWETSIKVNAVDTAFALGTGYVYPLIDYGDVYDDPVDSIKGFKVDYMRPAIYVKTIVDKIFEYAGYNFTSDSFFNSDLLKHLIIPYTGTGFRLSEGEALARYIEVASSTGAIVLSTAVYKWQAEAVDNFNQYDLGTGLLTVTEGGYYTVNGYMQTTTNTYPLQTPAEGYRITMSLQINGIEVYELGMIVPNFGTGSMVETFNTASILFQVGDIVRWVLKGAYDFSTDTVNVDPALGATIKGYCTFNADASRVTVGDTVSVSSLLSPDILQRDFLMSITKMFNLYWDSTDMHNQMVVKQREDYLSEDIFDFSKKLDLLQPVNILPMGALDANPYEWSYKPDTDYYNKLYTDEFNRTYGDYLYYINNDFIKEKKRTELIFSPTVLVNEPAWQTDMVVSSIKNYDSAGNNSPKGGNIRILYYGGLKDTSSYFRFNEGGGVYTTYTKYPYAGHLDDPYNSTIDLSFGTPLKIYFPPLLGSLTITGNNLFLLFWESFINEITNKDSKIVLGWFRLRAADVEAIDFAMLYYFMANYFRLNKIIDHDTGREGTTQIEFVKTTKPQE